MSASQSGVYNTQQFTDMGAPLVGGRLFTYAFGTTTHKTAFTDHAGAIPHTYSADGLGGQFIALDARGELPAPLYLTGGSYDLALKTAAGATVWTRRADPVWDITSDLSASSGASLVGANVHQTQDEVNKQQVSVKQHGAVGDGVTDDTAAIQAAINSFAGNDGGTVFFPRGRYRVDSQITINKAGIRLVGVSNRASMIISRCAGTTLHVEVLYSGTTNTDPGYCKFGIDNLAVGASYYGTATTTGTGLVLRNVFADQFNGLFMFGFKNHIVFDGAHMNKFHGVHFQNSVLDDPALPNFKTVIHNRGVAISGTGVVNPAGEMGGVGNSFDGGWFENVSVDTTNLGNTVFTNLDLEPASNSWIIGDQNIFKHNRIERFGVYAPAQYPYFPWFIVNGDQNIFEDNEYNVTGAVTDTVNPVYRVNGSKNKIQLPDEFFTTSGLVVFGPASEANDIDARTTFSDYQNTGSNPSYKNEITSILLGGYNNKVTYTDANTCSSVKAVRSAVEATGEFKNLAVAPYNLHNASWWVANDATVSKLAFAELPQGRGNLAHFAKVTLTASIGNRRFFASPTASLAATSGVYTAGFMLYIPSAATTGVYIGASLSANYEVNIRDKWVYVCVRGYFNTGDALIPTVRMLGVSGDYFMVGEICICKGETAAFSPHYDRGVTNPSSGKSNIAPISSYSGAGVLAGFQNVPFIFTAQDNATPANYVIATGFFPSGGIPTLNVLSNFGVGIGATNSGGTVTITGSADYLITVRAL